MRVTIVAERVRGHVWPLSPVCALVFVLAAALCGCGTLHSGRADGFAPMSAHGRAATRSAIRDILEKDSSAPQQAQILAFYRARDFRPVWIGSDEARARAASVTFALTHAGRQGLLSADYPVDAARADARPKPGIAAAKYDVTLTRSLFAYARDLRIGRVKPEDVYSDVSLPPDHFDVGAALSAALDDDAIDAFLASLPPPHAGYRRLVTALAYYRAIAAKGGWGRLSGKTRAKLVRRLGVEDAALAAIDHPSTDDVKAAVMRFQARHGLDTDGKPGPATLKALDVPVSRRIEEIEANMERWRWLPRHFAPSYIRVNVSDQSLDFIRDGKVVLHSKVVVGRPGKADLMTPILRTTVKAVIANPPWDIPDDIAAKSIVPHLRRNADYLEARNMVLMAPEGTVVDWRKVKGDVLPYQIQQKPGPDNVLGQLMLDMPNRFYVYLHGTPDQNLFALDNRDRSHGCVRVEKIGELAALALAGSVDDPDEAVRKAVAGGRTQRLALDTPLPVYLLYWTASVTPEGKVEFRPDRYGRDKALIARLGRRGT